MQRYSFDRRYGHVLAEAGISLVELLRKSHMPEDLFSRKHILLTEEEYLRMMATVGSLLPNDEAVVSIATWNDIHTFSPPVFAAYCSSNAIACVERLSCYKRLIGPMKFETERRQDGFYISLSAVDGVTPLPSFWVEVELVFLVSLIRHATKERICPLWVETAHMVENACVKTYLGCPVKQGKKNVLVLAVKDAECPFVSENEEMWNFFEPELKRRLSEMELDDSVGARVRSALIELLPGGGCRVDDVAAKLCVSARTLQRKLTEEGTTFQVQLNHVRQLLAIHYIKQDDLQSEDIAFLLGYQNTAAFLRAFNLWTGKTVKEYRQKK